MKIKKFKDFAVGAFFMALAATFLFPGYTIGQFLGPIQHVIIRGANELQAVDTVEEGGIVKLETRTSVTSVNVPNGVDPIPDAFFKILTAGALNDTIRTVIKATANDTTTPDDDLPECDVTTTVTASEVGNERALAVKHAQEIDADATCGLAFIEADAITGDKRAIIHISSEEFSLNGEFHERPNLNDVLTTVTGSVTIQQDSEQKKLVSRSKQSELSRSLSSPHDLGVLAISGTVSVQPGPISDILIEQPLESASAEMAIDASSVSKTFVIPCSNSVDKFVEELRCFGNDNGVKFGQFLGINSALTNGILITIVSDETTIVLPNITTTDDLKHRFALGGGKFQLDVQAGRDDVLASFMFENPFPIRSCGTNPTDDSVEFLIRDDLSSLITFQCLIFGFNREP